MRPFDAVLLLVALAPARGYVMNAKASLSTLKSASTLTMNVIQPLQGAKAPPPYVDPRKVRPRARDACGEGDLDE